MVSGLDLKQEGPRQAVAHFVRLVAADRHALAPRQSAGLIHNEIPSVLGPIWYSPIHALRFAACLFV